jgi:hypothetical protein
MFEGKNQINLIEKYQTSCIMYVSQINDLYAFHFSLNKNHQTGSAHTNSISVIPELHIKTS